jgi:murein L,D-transpeptidase YafK
MKPILPIIWVFFLLLLWAAPGYSRGYQEHPEKRLIQAIEAIQAVRLDQAQALLKALIQDEPEFKLAHMVYADILKARAHPLDATGMGLMQSEHWQQFMTEARARWQANQDEQYADKIPAVLSRLDDSYLHAIVVDLKQSRLFVFENRQQQPRQVASYFISMGRGGPEKEKQGDLRTPLGVYFVQSYIPPQKLADKYGAGAYPINYPNAWDQFNGRTGHGIWLHGTRSGTYNRPPLASEGCVVLPNSDLLQVGAYITLGQTPVLIGNDMQWLSVEAWQQQQQQVSAIFEQWLRDWESLDTRKYLGHYSTAFSNGSKSYYEWVRHKQRVARHKSFIDVEASDVSLLMHPNEDVLVATFLQYYSSDNYMSQSWKRQYWRKESDGVWRIIFEGQIAEPAAPQLARTSDTLLDTAN